MSGAPWSQHCRCVHSHYTITYMRATTQDTAGWCVYNHVILMLDHCNSLNQGSPKYLLRKLLDMGNYVLIFCNQLQLLQIFTVMFTIKIRSCNRLRLHEVLIVITVRITGRSGSKTSNFCLKTHPRHGWEPFRNACHLLFLYLLPVYYS